MILFDLNYITTGYAIHFKVHIKIHRFIMNNKNAKY
jgi:hypothetical protein